MRNDTCYLGAKQTDFSKMAEGQVRDLDLFSSPPSDEDGPSSPDIPIQSFGRGSYRSSLPESEKRTPTAISGIKRRPRGSFYGGKRTQRTKLSVLLDSSASDGDDEDHNNASDSEDEQQPETTVTRPTPTQQASAKEKESPGIAIQSDLKDIKGILVKLSEKVDKNERVLQELQASRSSPPSSSDSSPSTSSKKRSIPLKVRQEVRKVYKALLEDSENFEGWCLDQGSSFKSDQNQEVVRKLVKEVKGLNPSFDGADIREAANRFYKTKSEEESIRRSGKAEDKKITRRRQERLIRKKKEREATMLKNGKLSDEQRSKWLKVMTNDYMSSEESSTDDTIILHRPEWRSDYVTKMFERIDAYTAHFKSAQARRQTKSRTVGAHSRRPKPCDAPAWAIKA